MGRPKATLELAGRPLISYPVAAARAAGLEPVVVVKASSALPDLDCRIVTEAEEQFHPLAGIVAALEELDGPVVALACDLPLVPPALIAALAAREEDLVVPADPHPQPLAARYSPRLLPRLHASLVMEEPLVKLVADAGGKAIPPEELRQFGDPAVMFANANDPAELRRIEDLL